MRMEKISKKRILLFLAWLCAIIGLSIFCFEMSLRAAAQKFALSRGRSVTMQAVSESASQMNYQQYYDDLVQIERDEDGVIKTIHIDGFALNELMSEMATIAEKKIEELGSQPLEIPLSSIMGTQMLGTSGAKYAIECKAYASVDMDVESEFVAAGINQTKHRITAIVKTWVRFIMGGQVVSYEYENAITVVETIIVGEVPQTYLDQQQIPLLQLTPES